MTNQLSRLDIESLPNYRKKTAKEWSAACPQCNAGEDRFLFWPDKGNFFCRRCGFKGFVLEVNKSFITPEQREAWNRAKEERRRKEYEEQLSAIDRLQLMANRVDWYHSQVDKALDYFSTQGLTKATVDRCHLGYCPQCPTDPSSPSFTIPYFCNSKLINLRHRLKFPNGHGKYRPEFAGLKNQLFNLDTLKTSDEIEFGYLRSNEVLIVEGEIKTMVLEQIGFTTVGIPGANSWVEDWAKHFTGKNVYICLDPGALDQAQRIATSLRGYNIQGRVCQIPTKPDDFFVRYNGTPEHLLRFIGQGKRI